MAMRWQVTIDCAEPAKLAHFWALALGYEREPPPPGFGSWQEWCEHHGMPPEEVDEGASLIDPAGVGARLFFQRVPEPKVTKNRLHLDLLVGAGTDAPAEQRWARVTETVDRLRAAGATVVHQDEWQDRPHHVVMADPEGNEFCVV
ncbi:MAG TPA: VOC family protein [Pseudonocardiaceae bacterium]|jgi:catechol 2,3-dioxygenase-like lactoylglutathione lyase family enzyme